jgi:hypothetical protein
VREKKRVSFLPTSNLSLVEPLRGIIRIVGKARAEVTESINRIIDSIQRNNSKLADTLAAHAPLVQPPT